MGVAVAFTIEVESAVRFDAVIAKKYADSQRYNTHLHLVSIQLYSLQLCPKHCL